MKVVIDQRTLSIADCWQRDFPLCQRPFASVGELHGMTEDEVIAAFSALSASGVLSRVGAVVRPNTAGASTLAALSCDPRDLERVAAVVSGERFVNHNYERGHAFNLWFVVAAPTASEMNETLRRIGNGTGCEVMDLRLERPYHIDLGFSLSGAKPKPPVRHAPCRNATAQEKSVLAAIEDGLPLCSRPYLAVAGALGTSEDAVISMLRELVESGIVARFGCVIRHREVGFTANAMTVWDVPAEWVDAAGCRLASEQGVTLCYRRNRARPHWPYNLFAMVHGRDSEAVRRQVQRLTNAAGLESCPADILFSHRCFKQRGARFSTAIREAA